MTTIVRAAHRTGLTNVGAVQDELGYAPGRFADELGKARNGMDLCGCMLVVPYLYAPQTRESPRFEKSPLFRTYQSEFQALFDLAMPPAASGAG